jgi:AraC-like DNA-binding protein
MVNNRHVIDILCKISHNRGVKKVKLKIKEIQQLEYMPSGTSALDLEIFTISNLRERVGNESLLATHRYAFYTLILVKSGESSQVIDFKPIKCERGSIIIIKPGQAHNFGTQINWDGWMVLFRSEFLDTSSIPDTDFKDDILLDQIEERIQLREQEFSYVNELISKMLEDTRIKAPPEKVHALLRHQLAGLLLRLNIFYGQTIKPNNDSGSLKRFREFKKLVENKFNYWHQVGDYLGHMKCSEKSLSRATLEFAGVTAKSFIIARINLEAKRLLAHTNQSVTSISDALGFDEATNFVKFFKRDTGISPEKFRQKTSSKIKS